MIDFYRTLAYPIDGTLSLRHGVHDLRVEELLEAHGVTTAVYVTAWNPGGILVDPLVNRIANAKLGAELRERAVAVLPAPGAGGEGEWAPEESFFALGVDRATAMELGRRYGQLAVVFVAVGAPAEVLAI